MKIISIENPMTRKACQEVALKHVMFGAREAQERYLRHQFDISCVDATALAVIEAADFLGFHDLVSDMKADFKSETGREVAS